MPGRLERCRLRPARDRIIAATLVSLARYGVAKTTLEDVAKEAGCARATVYRYFGGKQQLLHAVIVHESAARPRRDRRGRRARTSPSRTRSSRWPPPPRTSCSSTTRCSSSSPTSPSSILPFVTFDGSDRFLAVTGAALAPTFARFLPAADANRAAQWCTRIFLAYLGADEQPRRP